MNRLFAIFCLALLFGCVSSEPQNPLPPIDQNEGVSNIKDLNSIRVNLDNNKIYFNFEIDLNSPELDLNVLAVSCSKACPVIGTNSWRLSKDLNFGLFYCTCTKEICYDQKITPTQIINYCRDDKLVLTFDANKQENN